MKNPVIKMADFLAKFAKAGGYAAQAAARESREHMMELFEERDGELHAKSVKVKVGDIDVDVPLISLTGVSSVIMRSMALKFAGSIDMTTEGEATMQGHSGLFKKAIDCEVVLKFDGTGSPEGMELIRDKLNKELSSKLSATIPAAVLTPAKPLTEEQ